MSDNSQSPLKQIKLTVTTIDSWQSVADTLLALDPKVILLTGNLGAGKTTFTKYLAQSLGATTEVTSPTFSIVNSYPAHDKIIYHMDLYRLESYDELFNAGIEEYFLESDAICIVEWPELIAESDLADDAIHVDITVDQEVRRVKITRE